MEYLSVRMRFALAEYGHHVLENMMTVRARNTWVSKWSSKCS